MEAAFFRDYFKRFFTSTALALVLLLPSSGAARPLEIIYTNDLHASFETYEHGRGGLAQIKVIIDRLKARAAAAGIDTLVTDAGDFMDGSLYRYGNGGATPIELLDAMQYDAVTMGNHDWLIGADQMNSLFGRVGFKTPVIWANLKIESQHQELRRAIKPYIQLEKAGAKIALLGLTTSQFLYKWAIDDGKIKSPYPYAERLVPELKKDHDFVFVLSHLGLGGDKKMIRRTTGVDLVIGGHSHDLLRKPKVAYSFDGAPVPIVQAGAHGEHVGNLLVDLEPGKPLRILRHDIIDVETEGLMDPTITGMIEEARRSLDHQYGPGWLSEPIAWSEAPLAPPKKSATPLGAVFAEAMREVSGADVSLDFSMFFGATQTAGPITREKLFNFYPRTYDITQPYGWTVWKARVPGSLLKAIVAATIEFGAFANTAGLDYKIHNVGKLKVFTKFRINGKKVVPTKMYDVAITEGIGAAAPEISKILTRFFKPTDTGVPVWLAVEEKLRKMGGRIPASVPH